MIVCLQRRVFRYIVANDLRGSYSVMSDSQESLNSSTAAIVVMANITSTYLF